MISELRSGCGTHFVRLECACGAGLWFGRGLCRRGGHRPSASNHDNRQTPDKTTPRWILVLLHSLRFGVFPGCGRRIAAPTVYYPRARRRTQITSEGCVHQYCRRQYIIHHMRSIYPYPKDISFPHFADAAGLVFIWCLLRGRIQQKYGWIFAVKSSPRH